MLRISLPIDVASLLTLPRAPDDSYAYACSATRKVSWYGTELLMPKLNNVAKSRQFRGIDSKGRKLIHPFGYLRVVGNFIFGATLGSLAVVTMSASHGERHTTARESTRAHRATRISEVLQDDGGPPRDLLESNLICASGLPGADDLDVEGARKTLEAWAARVKSETDRHLYRVKDYRFAGRYQNSESRFRAEMLVQVLQEDLGVHYNMDRAEHVDFRNSKDLFIHGMINSSNGGTCVSMPVLYAAVSRRLGYPVKLVEAKSHIFCRWEGGLTEGKSERFNFEGTGNGFSIFDDEHYRHWPREITDQELARGEYLKSLSPSEELAVFLAARGHCLLDNGRTHEAQIAYAFAHRLRPDSHDYYEFLVDAVKRDALNNQLSPMGGHP